MIAAGAYGAVALGAILFCSVFLATAGAVVTGIILHKPRARAAWLLLALAQLIFLGGTIVLLADSSQATFPGPSDVVYVMGYPPAILALMIFVRRRSHSWHIPTTIDAAILSTTAALLLWIYVLEPVVATPDTWARVVGLGYPIMDLAVVTVALRLAVSGGARPTAYYLLMGSLSGALCSDVAYMLERTAGTYSAFSATTVFGYLAFGMLCGLSALHPSMLRMEEPAPEGAPPATGPRLAALAVAALIPPGVLAVQSLRGQQKDGLVIALACAVLFLLVFARMVGLVAGQRRMAITDPLTGLHTRRFLDPALPLELERARRSQTPVGLLLIDIDHFKRVNDEHGHPVGDLVLREVARRLKDGCRSGDIVARYGGEEFAALLPGLDGHRLLQLAEMLRQTLATTPVSLTGGATLRVTASIGAASYPADAQLADDLIQAADQALYTAKRDGRDRVVEAGAATTALNEPSGAAVVRHPDGLPEPIVSPRL
jgi:diguanylate cyclase (GGDEF)-like protein